MLLRSCLSRYITISTMRTFTGKSRHIALREKHAFLSSLDYFVKNLQRPNQPVELTTTRCALTFLYD